MGKNNKYKSRGNSRGPSRNGNRGKPHQRANESVLTESNETMEPVEATEPTTEATLEPTEPLDPAVEVTNELIAKVVDQEQLEDAINAGKVFATLKMSPDRATGPLVVEKQELEQGPQQHVASPERTEQPVVTEGAKAEVMDETDGAPAKGRARKVSEGTVSSLHSSKAEEKETFVTSLTSEFGETEINTSRAIFLRAYHGKFQGFLDAIDPEVRYAANIGPCETFDEDGYVKYMNKLDEELAGAWPFDDKGFFATAEELKQLYSDIIEKVKFCLLLACCERGYAFKNVKKNAPVSSLWGENIDPMKELKTLEVIIRYMKRYIDELKVEGDTGKFWDEVEEYFGVIVPALKVFDSETLATKRISDSLATIYGRIGHGFEIKDEEVQKMLEISFADDGFGDFPTTVIHCRQVFKTAEQLKLIVPQLDKMSGVVDIRVKLAGLQAVTQILSVLPNVMEVMEELKGEPKLSMQKVFAFDPEKFDPFRKCPLKRTDYLKIFYTALQEKYEEHEFTDEQIKAALLCFYLIFPASEVNTVLFKILGAHAHDYSLDSDRRMIMRVLLKLPLEMRERLEVGEEFFGGGEIGENTDSMYSYIRSQIVGRKLDSEELNHFLSANIAHPIISVERIMRMCLKFIELGESQQLCVQVLNLLRRPHYKHMKISPSFFEDLLLLALTKYTVPKENNSASKFRFIETVFTIVTDFITSESPMELNEQTVVDRWTNMGHHWFTVLYMSTRFPALNFSSLKINYPWKSASVWDDDKNAKEAPAAEDAKNYAMLARVSLAWPDCSNMEYIQKLVAEHVPESVNRSELYTAMKEYVSGQTMEETWKKNLLKQYEKKIEFLSKDKKKDWKGKDVKSKKTETAPVKEEVQESKKPEKAEDLKVQEVQVVPEAPVPDVPEVVKVQEVANEVPQVEEVPGGSGSQGSQGSEESKESQKSPEPKEPQESEEIKKEVPEEPKESPEPVAEESKEQEEPIESKEEEKPQLTDEFTQFYPEEKWNAFPESIRNEVKRQRKLKNNL